MIKQLGLLFTDLKRQYIYLLLIFAVTPFVIFKIDMPTQPGKDSQNYFEIIESIESGSVALISLEYDYTAQPEIEPMLVSTIKHLLLKNVKIVFLSLWTESAGMIEPVMEEVFRSPELSNIRIEYGRDYVNLGYIPGNAAAVALMNISVYKAARKDMYGTSLESLEIMDRIHNLGDFDVVIDFFSGSVGGINAPVLYSLTKMNNGKNQTVLAGTTGTMAAEQYPFIQAGMIKGFLAGIKGAADYEALLADKGVDGSRYFMSAQSMAHLLIVLLIILAHIGKLMLRRKR